MSAQTRGNSGNEAQSQLWLLPAEGKPQSALIADVAVRMRTWRLYSYAVPDALQDRVRPGTLVEVPYGRGSATKEGWCTAVSRRTWEQTYKSIVNVVSEQTFLTPALVKLALWASRHYACPPGQTFDAVVPALFRKQRTKKVRYVRVTGIEPEQRLSSQQQALLAVLADGELTRDEALRRAGVTASSLSTLCKRGLAEVIERQEPVSIELAAAAGKTVQPPHSPEDDYALTAGQQAAFEQIIAHVGDAAAFGVFLLFGVPGSGKTEVYVRAIRRVIAAGRQAILLVPEIALATQIVERLARRFGRVAVLHSKLKASQRQRTLHTIAAGAADVVIGTRMAVFAPCPRLGLIVADEEQESSFKNLQTPFFHARDVACERGRIENVPVLLGSATPALTSWYAATNAPDHHLLRLPERVPGASFPKVEIAESDGGWRESDGAVLSALLADRLKKTLAAGGQAILLHNRRGYAAYLRCERCGLPVTCPRCGANMVYHRADNRLKCHRCTVVMAVPQVCADDSCGGRLQHAGLAIQRLEQELQSRFPPPRVCSGWIAT